MGLVCGLLELRITRTLNKTSPLSLSRFVFTKEYDYRNWGWVGGDFKQVKVLSPNPD